VTYGIDAPSGTVLSGNVAEWIVKDPSQAAGSLFPFSNFGQVNSQCLAASNTAERDLLFSTLISLADGQVPSMART
jgi:Peptidase A4 family